MSMPILRTGLWRAGGRLFAALAAFVSLAAPARAALTADRTLLVYNSQNADSLAVRNAYVAAHPGVRQLDLNDATLAPGVITRANYLAKIRAPIQDYLADPGPGGVMLWEHIIAMVTTRGLPARIEGTDEFALRSSYSSVESDLTLLYQDLEAAGPAPLNNRFNGVVDNPYHRQFGAAIDSFSRANITTQRAFTQFGSGANVVWTIAVLTPGDIYLVCRLDSAPTVGGASAVQNTIALINRSLTLRVDPCQTLSLFDEWACANHLDDDSFGSPFPGFPDFENARTFLQNAGYGVRYDNTTNFVSAPELLPDTRPLLAFGSYGENHSLTVSCANPGENPEGNGVYPTTYTYHPAAAFISYESWNGNSILDGAPRGNQSQVLDFIAKGGSFTVGTVAEPFTFTISDLEGLARSLYLGGMTFAEAAYIATPGLSWMQTPVGDPLAVVRVGAGLCDGDTNGDGRVDFLDLNAVLSDFGVNGACLNGDVNRDLRVDFTDLNIVLSRFGSNC